MYAIKKSRSFKIKSSGHKDWWVPHNRSTFLRESRLKLFQLYVVVLFTRRL